MNYTSIGWTEEHQKASEPDFYGKWIKCESELPELKDGSVLVYFPENGAIDMVHIEDYFKDITSGFDDNGKQLYTKWYLSQGVSHWMCMPNQPSANEGESKNIELFPGTIKELDNLSVFKCI